MAKRWHPVESDTDDAAVSVEDAARSCLFSVIDRFNNEDPFWGAFVPDPERTLLMPNGFSLTLRGFGTEVEVIGSIARSVDQPGGMIPTVEVGAKGATQFDARAWHRVDCTVDRAGRFVTSNFRTAIETSITEARLRPDR